MHSRSVTKSVLLLLVSLTMLFNLVSPAFAVSLLGNWIYRERGGDGLDTQSEFQQRYQLGVGPAVTYQLTPAITASGGVGYRNTQRDSGNGMESVEQVSPFGQISLINDIFLATASANSFTTMSGSDNSSAYWNASLNSAWDIPFWPTVQFNYGEDFAGVNNKSLFDDSNGKNQSTTASVDWDLLLANLYYEYNINESINGAGDSLSKATTHYGRFTTDGQFWKNRISLNLTQQYRETTTEFGEKGLERGPDGLFNIPVEGGASYLRTITTLAPDPEIEVVNLTDTPELTDGIYSFVDTDKVPPVRPLETGHFGFTPFDSQPINRLYLYLDLSVDPDRVTGLSWQIYTKRPTDAFWSLVIPNVVFSYNNSLGRFELVLPTIDGPEFLVVVTNPNDGVVLVFTELEAFRLASTEEGTGTPTFKSTYYQTNFGASFRPFSSVRTGFSLNYEHSDDKTDGETVRERDLISWVGSMSWTPLPYISPSISYGETLLEQTGLDDDLSRSYSASVSIRPLPSLNVSLGYTHNDQYADKDKTNKSDIYSLFTKASIYPDLSISLNNSYRVSDNLQTNLENREEFFVTSKTLSSRLDISARLHRYLDAYASGDYNSNDDEVRGKTENAKASCTLSYRPSSLLSLTSSYNTFFLDDERPDTFNASMQLYLLNTHKSRLSLTANHTQADESFNDFRVIGNWEISDYLSFTGNGTYNMSPARDTYSFYLSLAFRL